MSRDGQGEWITRRVEGTTLEDKMPCGGIVIGFNKARYRRCSLGHTHCMACLREARRFGKGWTCGICPGVPFGPMIKGVNPCKRCGWSFQFCDCGGPLVLADVEAARLVEIQRKHRANRF